MNRKSKRRLVVAGGVIAIAMLVIVAIAVSGGSASSLSIGDVAGGAYEGKKVQVSGSVVGDSLQTDGSTVIFDIQPENGASAERLTARYDGPLPATFGAGVIAICTGTVSDGALEVSELVTKCPSKYESAEGSLTVKGLMDQADSMVGTETKVCGYVTGGIRDVTEDHRFEIESQGVTMPVIYDGALSDDVADGTAVVVNGALQADGAFRATEQPAVDSSIEK